MKLWVHADPFRVGTREFFCYNFLTANEASFTDAARRKNTACPPLSATD